MDENKRFTSPVTYRASWLYGHTNASSENSLQETESNSPYPILSLKRSRIGADVITVQESCSKNGHAKVSEKDRPPEGESRREGSQADPEEDQLPQGSFKHILEDFSKETTAHGIVHITSAKSSFSRVTWAAIVVSAAGLMLVQMTLLLVQYFEFNVSVKVFLVSEKMLEFPSVTVCNTNKLRRSAVRDSIYSNMLILENNFVAPYYIPCLDGDFLCQNGIHCIKSYLVCDGVNHCNDMSDESHCQYPECGDDQFRCNSGSELGICISNDLLCDKVSTCYGGEDEDNCGECADEDFQCVTSLECIESFHICDGTYDCRDGSDESITICDPELSNFARGRPAAQSGRIYQGRGPWLATDGIEWTCAHTEWLWQPHWAVDLGKEVLVFEVRITHTETYEPRLAGSEIRVGPSPGSESINNPLCFAGVEEHETQQKTFTVRCEPTPVAGRYLSIHVKGKEEDMRVCEVEVMAVDSAYRSLADGKTATQSSLSDYGSAGKAVDGDKNNDFAGRSCTQTQKEYEPWWKVDLGEEYEIKHVIITNRADCCGYRLHGAVVRVGNTDVIANNTQCGEPITWDDIEFDATVKLDCSLQGRIVSVQLQNKTDHLSLCEVEVIGVEIAQQLPNVALRKPAEQSSTYYTHVASRAVDGNENFALDTGQSCTHSANEQGAWWRVDLQDIYAVHEVVIINRYDCCSFRIVGAVVKVGYYREEIDKNTQCGSQIASMDMYDKTIVRDCIVPIHGRYVVLQNDPYRMDYLHVCEVKVHATKFVRDMRSNLLRTRLFSVFDKQKDRTLPINSTDVIPNVSLHKCLHTCYYWKLYSCRSFDFHHATHTCTLHQESIGYDGIRTIKSIGTDFYQSLLPPIVIPVDNETDCPASFIRCTSGECVHPYQICDTLFDCADRFDELGCVNADINDTEHLFAPGWQQPYLSITNNLSTYDYFRDNIYRHLGYHRVKGEDPPDWLRFKTFSNEPDYTELGGVLKLTPGQIAAMGHQAEDFILQCTYAGEKCDPKTDFDVTQSDNYGNCFHFNAKTGDAARFSRGTGKAHGLSLTLFTEQSEYLSVYGQDSAAVVSIAPRTIRTFPADNGFFAMPGTVTSVSLQANQISRQMQPYGNCTDEASEVYIPENVRGNYDWKAYSIVACEKACFHAALLNYCGCTETTGIDAPPCGILNETKSVCSQLIYFFYQSDLLPCTCPPPCREMKYLMTISQSQWPSYAYLNNLLKLVKVQNPKTRNLNDLESARSNLVRLNVYFESLNYETTSEHPAYMWEDLLSDVGGTLGLYVGLSVITVCEIVRFFATLCGICLGSKEDKHRQDLPQAPRM